MKTRLVAAYATGSIPTGIIDSLPTVILLYYATEKLGLSPTLTGSLIFLVRCIGFISDPLAGKVTDRFLQARGSAIRLYLLGLILVSGGYATLFLLPPLIASGWQYVAVAVGLGAITAGSSCTTIPHFSMAASPALTARQSQRVVAARSVTFMIGLLIGGSFAPIFIEYLGADLLAYAISAITVSASMAAMILPMSFAASRWPSMPPAQSVLPGGLFEFKNRQLRLLLFANMLQVAALATCFTALPYLVDEGSRAPQLGLLIAIVVITAATSIGIWNKTAGRFGLTLCFALGGIVFAAGTASLGIAHLVKPEGAYFLGAVLCGAGLGAIQFAAYALLAQCLQKLIEQEPAFPAASVVGFWTAFERATLALGPLMVGVLLDLAGNRAAMAVSTISITTTVVVLSLFPLCIFPKFGTPHQQSN